MLTWVCVLVQQCGGRAAGLRGVQLGKEEPRRCNKLDEWDEDLEKRVCDIGVHPASTCAHTHTHTFSPVTQPCKYPMARCWLVRQANQRVRCRGRWDKRANESASGCGGKESDRGQELNSSALLPLPLQ